MGRVLPKDFIRINDTNPSFKMFNKFEGEEIWGVDCHCDDLSGAQGALTSG